MKKLLIVLAVLAASAALFVGVTGVWGLGVYNEEAGLKNQYEMKVVANEATFDNMWKSISQTSQVTDAQKNALKEIFNGYATARAGNGNSGSVMAWIKEAIPHVDVSVYKNLMNIILGSRDGWTRNQLELVQIASQYNNNLQQQPRGFVLKMFGFNPIDPKVITSTRTDNAFKTGKDDDVSLPIGDKK